MKEEVRFPGTSFLTSDSRSCLLMSSSELDVVAGGGMQLPFSVLWVRFSDNDFSPLASSPCLEEALHTVLSSENRTSMSVVIESARALISGLRCTLVTLCWEPTVDARRAVLNVLERRLRLRKKVTRAFI